MTRSGETASKGASSPSEGSLGQQRLRTIMDGAADAVITTDASALILYLNPSAQKMFGLGPEHIGKPLTILMPERFRDEHRRGIDHYLKTGEARVIGRTVELVGLRGDQEFPIEVSFARWGADDEVLITAIIRDITARKTAEEALAESERRFRELVEHVPTALFKTTGDGTIVEANRACARLLGLPGPEALVGRNSSEVYADARERDQYARAAAKAGEVSGIRVRLRRADGTFVWVMGAAKVTRSPDGGILAFEGSFDDISHQVELEAAKKRLAELQDLVIRVMGHDLKAPIAVMQGYLELARAEVSGSPLAPEAKASLIDRISRANQAAAGMQVVLANARAISRLEMAPGTAPQAELLDLDKIVRETVELMRPLADAKGQVLAVKTPGVLHAVLPPGFESVVSNLLSNAIKYTPERGRIEVTLQEGEHATVFTVADSGPGITPDKRPLLFRKFERLALEQSVASHGLGLSITAAIVGLAGGTIAALDRPDGAQGTLFRVELPLPA